MTPCAIVPSRDHAKVIGDVVARLRAAGLPVFVIDDGSGPDAARVIAALDDNARQVWVHRLPVNQGKGAAVMAGFARAAAAGFSHAVQVDADGQHDLDALPALLNAARAEPDAVICGQPVYDASMPCSRRIGRWITHAWVAIETWSLHTPDSMCGFRVYPLAAVGALMAQQRIGQRMEFDTDILVRLIWRGTPARGVAVRVTYPPDNTSNFDLLRDNLRITVMHTRLVIARLRRLVRGSRWREPQHWAALTERGAQWGLELTAFVARVLGRRASLVLLAPVVGFFLLTGGAQRRASRGFLTWVTGRRPGLDGSFRHFMSFAASVLDGFLAWTQGLPEGAVVPDDEVALARLIADPRGALFVVAHVGNPGLAQASLDPPIRARLTILVHSRHAANFAAFMRRHRPEAVARHVQVTELGPERAIELQQRVERGEWVVIAGDRTPVGGGDHVSRVLFFGAEAAFPHGPWILASLLRCPVHLLFCVRDGARWRLTVEPFAERLVLPRADRGAALRDVCARYAARLEAHVRQVPLQWYNFYDFWAG